MDLISRSESAVCYLLIQSSTRSQVPISLKPTVCIPGRVEVLVCFQLPKNNSDQLGMVSPLNKKDSLPSCNILAYTACHSEGREIYSRLIIIIIIIIILLLLLLLLLLCCHPWRQENRQKREGKN